MSLRTGRLGWIGVGLQSAFQVPAAISDYVPFTANTLHGMQEQIKINHATGYRELTTSSVPGKRYGTGDIEFLLDSKLAGYFLVGAMGTVNVASLGGGVFKHTISRNNSNTPQYLTVTNDRTVDRQNYYDVTVDQLEIEVGTDLATVKAKLNSSFPQTTVSGTLTTASGNLMTFRNAQFAFGTTVSAAQNNPNLKPHDFKVTINNNSEVVHRHGSGDAAVIANKDFDIQTEMTLYFENTTDRDTYYSQSKQAASLQFLGNGIGSGLVERLNINFFQVSIDTFELETGISDFYAEKVTMNQEFDNVSGNSINMELWNNKSLYI